MSSSMTLMICVILFFVIVTSFIVVDSVKNSCKLKDVETELDHCKSENITLSQIVEFRNEDIKDLKNELEKANKTIKRLTDTDVTHKVTVVRTERPLTVVTCCIEIPNELLYDKLEEHEIRRMENAFMHHMYKLFKQSILPSADFTLEDDFKGFHKRLVCQIPVTVPATSAINQDIDYPITDLILRLSKEPEGGLS